VSDNEDISIVNNLVIGTGGNPQYARNDGSSVDVAFGHQLWGGLFRNSGTPTPGIPVFPAGGDVVVGESGLPFVLVDPTVGNIDGRANAIARYRPISGSIALSAGQGTALVSRDILGVLRSETSPSIGAFETP
jgi:hypothetical protein